MAEEKKAPAAEDNKIDHYVRLGTIAMGKHAQVLEVQEENTTNRFAMKVLLSEAMQDPEQVAILKFEGKVAQSLDHPNLIKWFATVNRKTNIYLILELFKSPNLKSNIMLDIVGVHTRLRKLIDCTCQALNHMHERGWVHLDVKPDNILMSRASEVRVIDFSLSERIKGTLGKIFSGRKEIGGTLTYIAPETIRKEAPSPATDIYSLGITLYECLTGTMPFKGSTPKDLLMKHLTAVPIPPSDLNKNVTPEMDRMVLRMLAKKTKDRQKNMQEVMSEFRNIQPFKEDPEKLRDQRLAEEKAQEGQQSLGKRLDSRTDHTRSEKAKVDPEFAKQVAAAAAAANTPPQPKSGKPEPVKPKLASNPQPAAAVPQPSMPTMPMPMAPGFAQQMPFMPMPQMMPGQYAPMPGYGYPGMPQQMPGYPPGAGPMPGMMPMPMHPAAMMPMPGMPMPGMPMPGMPMPGMPMPGMPMPGMPMPGMPMPGMPMPGMPGVPQQMMPPQMAPPSQPQPDPGQPTAPERFIPGSFLNPGQRPEPPPSAKDVDDLPMMEELPDVL